MADAELLLLDVTRSLITRIPAHRAHRGWITVGDSSLNDVRCDFIPSKLNMQVSCWNAFVMVKLCNRIKFGFQVVQLDLFQKKRIECSLTRAKQSDFMADFVQETRYYEAIYQQIEYEDVKREFVQSFEKPFLDSRTNHEFMSLIADFISGSLHLFKFLPGKEVVLSAFWAIALFLDLRGNGPMAGLLAASDCTEIALISPDQCWVERYGKWERLKFPFSTWVALQHWLLVQSCRAGAELFSQRGFSDFALSCGSRVHVAFPPVARDSGSVTIRLHRPYCWTMQKLNHVGMLSNSQWNLLDQAINDRKNILLVGPTSSGKTTLLSALIDSCSHLERILVLEDVAELKLSHPHVVYLQCRASVPKDGLQVSLDDLVREALRMRPDRLVVGECRGREAFALLQALHTGHQGSLCTLHGNSISDAIDRFQSLVLQAQPSLSSQLVKRMIHSSIDLVILLKRDAGGVRRILDMRSLRYTE